MYLPSQHLLQRKQPAQQLICTSYIFRRPLAFFILSGHAYEIYKLEQMLHIAGCQTKQAYTFRRPLGCCCCCWCRRLIISRRHARWPGIEAACTLSNSAVTKKECSTNQTLLRVSVRSSHGRRKAAARTNNFKTRELPTSIPRKASGCPSSYDSRGLHLTCSRGALRTNAARCA